MQRSTSVTSLLAGVFLLVVLPFTAIAAGGTSVDRASFLREAVETLYGELNRNYTAPYKDVPEDVRNAVGFARALGAGKEWGNDALWQKPVTRGEALTMLFALAQKEPQAGTATAYRDVRGTAAGKIVKQALTWKLLSPLHATMFGWNRTVSLEEFTTMLERLQSHIQTPLLLPATGTSPATRGTSRSSPAATPTKKIMIKKAQTDSGAGRMLRRELPRSDLLEAVWGLVKDKFLYQDRVKDEEIAYAMAETLLEKLGDPYTAFLPPQTNERFQEQIQGSQSFTGIGAHVELHPDGGVRIVAPLPESPAFRAGVKAGDRVIAVDDVSTIGMSLNDAVSKIRGPDGTPVRLTIERGGLGGSMVITVIRGAIVLQDVTVTMQDGIAVLRITTFSKELMTKFNATMASLMKQNPAGIILDLRNNPGGLLDGAILVASHFLPENALIVSVERRTDTTEHKAIGGVRPVPATLPVVVLVNKGSASASEIVAAALKDHGRAEIIGETTFGKGTVQEAVEFAPNPGETAPAAKITVARWLSPKNEPIEGNGVEPTIPFADTTSVRDEMLLEAIKVIKTKATTR